MKLKIAYITVLFFSLAIPSAFADTVSTEIDDTSYDIDYNANNVVLKSVTADLDFISLIFETEVSGSEGDVSILSLIHISEPTRPERIAVAVVWL